MSPCFRRPGFRRRGWQLREPKPDNVIISVDVQGNLYWYEQRMPNVQALVEAGVRKLVVAGGETSGAVTQALGIERLRIGASICPGVPWTEGRWKNEPLWLALKSGNFGGPDFFSAALACADVQA